MSLLLLFQPQGGSIIPTLPSVDTESISNIGTSSAVATGALLSNGNDPVVRVGFVYSPTSHANPGDVDPDDSDYEFSVEQVGSSFPVAPFGNFIDGLSANTTYFIRAFAENGEGFAYGDQISFTTTTVNPPLPIPSIVPQNNNPKYQILVRDKEGTILGEITGWLNLQFSDKLNNFGECSFDLPVDSDELATLVSLRRYETLVLRNGAVVWSGEQALRGGKLMADSPNLIKITSFTFVEMLNHMRTEAYKRFDQEDQGQILKYYVDEFQSRPGGNLGFTFDEIVPTMPRDRETSRDSVMELYINMSNVINGPDFWIDENKVIHIVPYRGIDKSRTVVLEYGVNILEAEPQENFSNPVNSVIVLGEGFGEAQLVSSYEDTASRDIYGLRQTVISEIDVSEPDTLTAKGQAFVRKYRQSIFTINGMQTPNTEPTFGSVLLGDSVGYRLRKGIYDVNSVFRIYGYTVRIGENGEEFVSYLAAQTT
jgi:hypothetical protein